MLKGKKTKTNRLCLLCKTYMSKFDFKKHLNKCEKEFKKERNLC